MHRRICHFWIKPLLALSYASLIACSSGNTSPAVDPGSGTDPDPTVSVQPPDIQLDAPALVLGPEIAAIVRPTNTDLIVAYSDETLLDTISVEYIVGEWENMKLCLGAAAFAPYIVIVDGFLDSVASDDVIFNFEGRRLASATWNRDGINVARVSSFDFDGSQGNPGFHLRSIFGRYIWTLSELPTREYNTACASGS